MTIPNKLTVILKKDSELRRHLRSWVPIRSESAQLCNLTWGLGCAPEETSWQKKIPRLTPRDLNQNSIINSLPIHTAIHHQSFSNFPHHPKEKNKSPLRNLHHNREKMSLNQFDSHP